jgi:hypothetical protein
LSTISNSLLLVSADSLTESKHQEQVKSIQSLAFQPQANPVLQLLLSIPGCRPIVQSALFPAAFLSSLKQGPSSECFKFVDKLVYDPVGSHLLEKVICNPCLSPSSSSSSSSSTSSTSKSAEKLQKSLFKHYFSSRILECCDHPVSNFVLQALVLSLVKEDQVVLVLDALLPRLSDLVFGRHGGNRMGVLVKLVQACVAFPRVQERVCRALELAFEVPVDGDGDGDGDADADEKKRNMFAPLVLHIRTFKVSYSISFTFYSSKLTSICISCSNSKNVSLFIDHTHSAPSSYSIFYNSLIHIIL